MSKEIAIRTTSVQDALGLQQVARGLFASGLYRSAGNEFGAYAIVQYGHELGVGPMTSLQSINLIQGKPAASGQLMLSLAMSRGVTFQVEEESETRCVILFKRGDMQYRADFSLEDAKRANLAGKDNWKKWPREMLYWRAVAKGVRRIAPEACLGLYTPEEITNGEVIELKAEIVPDVPAFELYDLADIHAHAEACREIDELAAYLKALAIPKEHPQRAEIVAIYNERKAAIERRKDFLQDDDKPQAEPQTDEPMTDDQRKVVMALYGKISREERLSDAAAKLQIPALNSFNDLTRAETSMLIGMLQAEREAA